MSGLTREGFGRSGPTARHPDPRSVSTATNRLVSGAESTSELMRLEGWRSPRTMGPSSVPPRSRRAAAERPRHTVRRAYGSARVLVGVFGLVALLVVGAVTIASPGAGASAP